MSRNVKNTSGPINLETGASNNEGEVTRNLRRLADLLSELEDAVQTVTERYQPVMVDPGDVDSSELKLEDAQEKPHWSDIADRIDVLGARVVILRNKMSSMIYRCDL